MCSSLQLWACLLEQESHDLSFSPEMFWQSLLIDFAAGEHVDSHLLLQKLEEQDSEGRSDLVDAEDGRLGLQEGSFEFCLLFKGQKSFEVNSIDILLAILSDLDQNSIVFLHFLLIPFEICSSN